MVDTKFFDEMAHKFADSLPPAFKTMKDDLERCFKATMQSCFAKMDLVTREEFDVQKEILKRTQAKLKKLESEMAGKTTPQAKSNSKPKAKKKAIKKA